MSLVEFEGTEVLTTLKGPSLLAVALEKLDQARQADALVIANPHGQFKRWQREAATLRHHAHLIANEAHRRMRAAP